MCTACTSREQTFSMLKEERNSWVDSSVPDFVATTTGPQSVPTICRRPRRGMWKAAESVMGRWPGTAEQQAVARQIATLTMRLGRLGLRSARRMAPAAFWAYWADAMPMLSERLPTLTDQVIEHLENGGVGCRCLQELTESTLRLDRSGFINRPEWSPLREGVRPPALSSAEPDEWQHGWQYHAAGNITRFPSLEYHHRETVIVAQSCAADQAHLRSHSGPGASEVLHGAPTSTEFKVEPQLLRTLILERLRLPLHATDARCECGAPFDELGRHRTACRRSGRLRVRAVNPERTLGRVCREAGATVRCNTKLRDMNVAVSRQR